MNFKHTNKTMIIEFYREVNGGIELAKRSNQTGILFWNTIHAIRFKPIARKPAGNHDVTP